LEFYCIAYVVRLQIEPQVADKRFFASPADVLTKAVLLPHFARFAAAL
jgi:hypothetical protein